MIILNFVIAFATIILIHELGHFIAAKLFGISVDVFSVGFGPRLIGKEIAGTDYRISLVPLGGYVKMPGIDTSSKPVWQRIAVSLAGPAANLIFALAVLVGLFAAGVPSPTARIGSLQPGKPAMVAGVQAGDLVVSVNNKPVKFWEDLIGEIGYSRQGRDLQLGLLRNGVAISVSIMPESKNGKPFIGIAPSLERVIRHYSLADSIQRGGQRWWKEVAGFWSFVSGFTNGSSAASDIGGPVAIASAANKAAQAGVGSFMLIIAVLSVSLGMFNLIPVPILDGGAVLMYLYEWIVGKAAPQAVQLRLNQAGIFGLTLLIAWAFLNDLGR